MSFFLLSWPTKRPKSFFAASLQLNTYISFSEDLNFFQFASLICSSHLCFV